MLSGPLKVFITFLVIFWTFAEVTTADDQQKAMLRDRCFEAIETGEVPAKRATLKESVIDLTGGHYLFEFTQQDGGVFHCDICDEANRNANCFTMGLELNHRPAGGESKRLPAELDRKCIYFLQKELSGGPPKINHDLVQRIGAAAPHHTDTRWVYEMHLDETEYRCVIRKSDGNFRLERHEPDDDWRPIAAGIMF